MDDTLINATCERWPMDWLVFKIDDLNDANGEQVSIMKIAPILFFVAQYHGLDEDLEASLLLERIQSVKDFKDEEEYLQHAANFLKACMVQHPSNKNRPSLDMAAFSARASKDDRTWACLCLTQFFQDLVHEQVSAAMPEKQGKLAMVLKLLLDHNKAKEAPPSVPINTKDGTDEVMEGTWEKKLGLSTTALKNVQSFFCALDEGEEDHFPSYLLKMAEKHSTKNVKDIIIHQVLSNLLLSGY